MIYCGYPRAQYQSHREEIDAAIRGVLDGQVYILGENVAEFEKEFAAYIGAAESVGVANGTDAICLALRALGVGPGDEVITPSHTAVPTITAIEMAGAKPVFIDILPDSYTIDPAAIGPAVSDKTKAVIAVHLYGQAADMASILAESSSHGLKVIEDCAQAHGAQIGGQKVGTFGDVGCFSFFPTKNLGAIGDGGGIVTNDADVASNLRQLRQYGWDDNRISQTFGWNSRLDELQAAILRVKLKYLDQDTDRRIAIANRYDEAFSKLPLTLPWRRQDSRHVFHLYVVQSDDRDGLIMHLKRHEIAAGIHYKVPAHTMPLFKDARHGPDGLTNTDALVERIVTLPVYPELSNDEQQIVIDAVTCFYN